MMLAKLLRLSVIGLAALALLAAPAAQPAAAARPRTGTTIVAAVNWNGIQKGASR